MFFFSFFFPALEIRLGDLGFELEYCSIIDGLAIGRREFRSDSAGVRLNLQSI